MLSRFGLLSPKRELCQSQASNAFEEGCWRVGKAGLGRAKLLATEETAIGQAPTTAAMAAGIASRASVAQAITVTAPVVGIRSSTA